MSSHRPLDLIVELSLLPLTQDLSIRLGMVSRPNVYFTVPAIVDVVLPNGSRLASLANPSTPQ